MNSKFYSAAVELEENFQKLLNEKFRTLQASHTNTFSKEAIIKLAVKNNFDDRATLAELLELYIRQLHLDVFK